MPIQSDTTCDKRPYFFLTCTPPPSPPNHPHTQVGEWHAPSKALMPTRGRWGQRTADSIGFSAHSGRANRRHTHRRVGRRRRRREEIFGPRGSFPAGGPCSRTFKTRRPRTCSANVQNSAPRVFIPHRAAQARRQTESAAQLSKFVHVWGSSRAWQPRKKRCPRPRSGR